MCSFLNSNGCTITYDLVRQAMGSESYPMSLTSESEVAAVISAVNQGIDSHLEACFMPELGDAFAPGARTTRSGAVITRTLECVVSQQSLPVLLRRLFESGDDQAWSLAEDILTTLGIDETGKLVGREALGLD